MSIPLSLIDGGRSAACRRRGRCIWWTLRSLDGIFHARSLLTGRSRRHGCLFPKQREKGSRPSSRRLRWRWRSRSRSSSAPRPDRVGRVAGFFGAGTLSLLAMLCSAARLAARVAGWAALQGHGTVAGVAAGPAKCHGSSRRAACSASPSIAFATFVIVAVEAFKRDDTQALLDRHSGAGGYPLLLESLLPIVHDLNSSAGRDALNLPAGDALQGVRFDRFRVRPGDDTSCLNLYQPRNPRILSAPRRFRGRRPLRVSELDGRDDRPNGPIPGCCLNREFPDGAIPVITDANSHDLRAASEARRRSRAAGLVGPARAAAARRGAVGQHLSGRAADGGDRTSSATFPEREGYRFFLLDAAARRERSAVTELLEIAAGRFRRRCGSTAERLAGFHRVEYTYLSTFQMLGGLGLLLGTLGLGAVLLRNVLERRRELALLRALGYRQADFFAMVMAENVLLLLVWPGRRNGRARCWPSRRCFWIGVAGCRPPRWGCCCWASW